MHAHVHTHTRAHTLGPPHRNLTLDPFSTSGPHQPLFLLPSQPPPRPDTLVCCREAATHQAERKRPEERKSGESPAACPIYTPARPCPWQGLGKSERRSSHGPSASPAGNSAPCPRLAHRTTGSPRRQGSQERALPGGTAQPGFSGARGSLCLGDGGEGGGGPTGQLERGEQEW